MDSTKLVPNGHSLDIGVVIVANIINVLVIGIFLSRAVGKRSLEHTLGLVLVALALPLLFAAIRNLLTGREWWTVGLPSIMIVYLILELFLDYILKINFRHTPFLWPYLALFYLAFMMMIGYAFLTGRVYGYITLTTYFLGLLATWYSYSKVGHG